LEGCIGTGGMGGRSRSKNEGLLFAKYRKRQVGGGKLYLTERGGGNIRRYEEWTEM